MSMSMSMSWLTIILVSPLLTHAHAQDFGTPPPDAFGPIMIEYFTEPPPDDFHSAWNDMEQGFILFWVLGLLGTLIPLFICMYWMKRVRKPLIQALQASVAQPVNMVDVAHADAPTMEKFLEEMAKEKPVRFTAQQLCTFTSNYRTKLGSGGFGVVYKGHFPNGVKIAVKALNRSTDKSAETQFMAEVATIGKTYHACLVRLYGFCYDQYLCALVYEYMEKGSLDKYLFGCENRAIPWGKLHDIAIGTAKGIAYLHHGCEQRIIHYDIKPGNILLDTNFSPKVADFGLAKLCNRDITHVSVTGYRGTPGYSAPEFLLHNHAITHKCDVYSFGMVLFEVFGRRRNTVGGSSDSMDWFPKRVWDEYEKGELGAMALASEIGEEDREKAERMCKVALWCVQDAPEGRPTMEAVVKMLEGGVEIVAPPKPFHYLYSIAIERMGETSETSDGSSYVGDNKSCWYKETTPIMAKYEIQVANV